MSDEKSYDSLGYEDLLKKVRVGDKLAVLAMERIANDALNENISDCQYAVSFCYFSGTGVEKDITRAQLFLEKSASNDNTYALHGLSEEHRLGVDGYEQNDKRAQKFCRRALNTAGCRDKAKLYFRYA